jgi:hypothetical protein
MRKLLFALSACVLCAAPLQAQSAQSAQSLTPAPQASEAVATEQREAPKPSLYPTTDEVRQQVARTERQRVQGEKAAIPNDFLYLVAAIIVGVVIAALVLN